MNDQILDEKYLIKYNGSFHGILRWYQLDDIWDIIRDDAVEWYIYQIGEEVPQDCVTSEQLNQFLLKIDELLRSDHGEDYCGIVYVDHKTQPSFIKIYDPNNLGSACGSSGAPPPLPGWTITKQKPIDLKVAFPPPANRKRWWKKLFI